MRQNLVNQNSRSIDAGQAEAVNRKHHSQTANPDAPELSTFPVFRDP